MFYKNQLNNSDLAQALLLICFSGHPEQDVSKRRYNKVKRIGSKQLIPIAMALMGVVFAVVGFTQLGFWDKEPKAGFFPSIIAVVMVISSVAAFFQTL